MLIRFCLYGFLKNQRYFEPYFMLALLSKQLSFFEIGVLYACRWLTLNLLEIPSGVLADAWGRRRCMLLSFAAYIISFLFFAFADTTLVLAAAMIMFGIGDAFRTGTHKAMIFHWLRTQGREHERTRIYGLTRSWSKIGSAVSALLAAGFLLLTRDYQTVFLLAAVPCLLNMVNLIGYPEVLEGEEPAETSSRATTLDKRATASPKAVSDSEVQRWPMVLGLRNALHEIVVTLRERFHLRKILLESIAWEGVFHAVKDYLQPVILVFVLVYFSSESLDTERLRVGLSDLSTADPLTIVSIAAVYFVLFMLSAQASRSAHLVVVWSGSAERAAVAIWLATATLYLGILTGALAGLEFVLVVAFAALTILQNVWRPILIGRIDQHSDSVRGATILSIESQSQRIATMLLAPLIGFAVDWSLRFADRPDVLLPSTLAWWPIGALGLVVATVVLVRDAFRSERGSLP